jgi:hypothetical protein
VGLAKGGTMTTYRGTYRDGAVHFHTPLDIPENTEVNVSLNVIEVQHKKQTERERIHEIFVAEGLVKPRSTSEPKEPPLSPEYEAELARKLAKGGAISDLINKDRDEQDDRLLL